MSLIHPSTLRLPPTASNTKRPNPRSTQPLQLEHTGDAVRRQVLFNKSNQEPPEVPNEDLHIGNKL